jgi:hypothetical protein
MSSKKALSVRAITAESSARALEAKNRELEVQLAVATAAPPPPPPVSAPPPPPTPLSDRFAELQRRPDLALVAASFFAEHGASMLAEQDAKAAHGKGGAPPAAPAAAPPPPAAPVTPAPQPRTHRDVHRELKASNPYAAAGYLLQHQGHLDQPVPQ